MRKGSTTVGSIAEVLCPPYDVPKKGVIQPPPVDDEDSKDKENVEANDGINNKAKYDRNDADTALFRKSQRYTMNGLEHALQTDAGPLQRFAALRDFSGENVSFLTHVLRWKKIWASRERERENLHFSDARDQERVDEVRFRHHFNRAINVYTTFVSAEFAMFPIDVSPSTLQQLDSIFAGPAKSLLGQSRIKRADSSATMVELARRKSPLTIELRETIRGNSEAVSVLNLDDVWYWDDISEQYSTNCFDDAEREIKFLVLTNTWPKFLNVGLAKEVREAEGEMIARRLSQFFTHNLGT